MKLKSVLSVFPLAIAVCFSSCKEKLVDEASGQLKTISYNVAGLPQFLSSSNPELYTTLISPHLNDFDIVHVQEDFCYHDSLLLFNSHPYKTAPSGCVPEGDGLNTFSNYCILDFERITWDQCFGFDCATPKGFSYSRIEIAQGVTIDFYNVHCNAGKTDGDYAARRNNINQLLSYVNLNSQNQPVIIMGDFNNKYTRSNDSIRAMSSLGFTDAWIELIRDGDVPSITNVNLDNCYPTSTSIDCEGVDKTFYRSSDQMKIHAISFQYGDDERFFYNGIDTLPLSDHEPLIVNFSFNFKRN